MIAEWFFIKNGGQFGPFTVADLQSYAQSGSLLWSDLVWKQGLPEWTPAWKVAGLFPTGPSTQPPTQHPRDGRTNPANLQGKAKAASSNPFEFSEVDDIQTDDQDEEDGRRPAKKSTSLMKLILLIGGGMVLLVVIGVVFFGSKASELKTNADRKLTIPSADEEFRISASQKGEWALGAAKMLIELRNDDKWAWERLESEVDFQFQGIKAEFGKWKRDRIPAGDRYK